MLFLSLYLGLKAQCQASGNKESLKCLLFLSHLCEKNSLNSINSITTQRSFFMSELNLKILDVMREKHKVVRQRKASNTKES
jgi:hypothetical protein